MDNPPQFSTAVIDGQSPFRAQVLAFQGELQRMVESGDAPPVDCPLTHRFVPTDATYGCAVYAREIFLPGGSVIVGKIHKHTHLAFLLKGTVLIVTEAGREHVTAPHTFISPAGVKRVLYIIEDATITTVHLTKYSDDQHLDEIEDEIIAPTYEDLDRCLAAQPQRVIEESECLTL